MKRGIICGRCGYRAYSSRAQAEAACIRKGCPITAVYRCNGLYHFNADTYVSKPWEGR